MYSSRLITFLFLLLPLQTIAEVYDVYTTAELREALASAAEAGGDNTIRLAAGTYSTQDDNKSRFEYVSELEGRLSLVAQDSDNRPALDGADADTILQLYAKPDAFTLRIDGLIFQNAGGPAIVNRTTEVTRVEITNSLFRNNMNDSGQGGAIFFWVVRDLLIEDSIFQSNETTRSGGALTMLNATSYSIARSTFRENVAGDRGGAIEMGYFSGSGVISNSTFSGNNAGSEGGAIRASDATLILGNRFENNQLLEGNRGTAVYGGMLRRNIITGSMGAPENNNYSYQISFAAREISNNLFLKNEGAHVNAYYAERVSNNIFHNTSLAAFDDAVITNNIFLDNTSDLVTEGDSSLFVSLHNNYLDITALTAPFYVSSSSSGNIYEGVNLGFVNAEEGDYRLTSSSGLIDAGTIAPELANITDYDYTGTTARVIGASIDIGPYEYYGEAPPDSDGDGLNDNIDNCPSIANKDQADFDSDGEGDACDSDDDNDGTNDDEDAFPFDDTESLDTDSDGIGNNEDYDDDADGILDSFDSAPLVVNTIVVDSDSDGVIDSADVYPNDPTKQYSGSGDLDGDGYSNDEEVDYCSNPFDKNSQPKLGGLSPALLRVISQEVVKDNGG